MSTPTSIAGPDPTPRQTPALAHPDIAERRDALWRPMNGAYADDPTSTTPGRAHQQPRAHRGSGGLGVAVLVATAQPPAPELDSGLGLGLWRRRPWPAPEDGLLVAVYSGSVFDSFRHDASGPASGRGSVPAVPLGEPAGGATSGRRSVLVRMAGTFVPYPVARFGRSGIPLPFREPDVHLLGLGPPPGVTRRSEPHPAREL